MPPTIHTDTDQTQPAPSDLMDDDFDLDLTIIEKLDPATVINMTDDNCGHTCAGTTCITNG